MNESLQIASTIVLAVLGLAQTFALFVLTDLRSRIMRLESKFMESEEPK